MFRAAIFDFDGVITDSEILHLNAFNRMLKQFGLKITTRDYYDKYLGLSDIDLIKQLISEGLLNITEDKIQELAEQKKKIFETLAEGDGNIIEGVPQFLQMLRDNGIVMAICSGALLCEIEFILEKAKLRDFFETIVSAEQVEKGKPAPDGFLLALTRLNEGRDEKIRPEQCIVIEDSHWGLEAAVAAGMPAVAVTNSYSAEQLSLADIIVDDLRQLNIDQLHQLCRSKQEQHQ